MIRACVALALFAVGLLLFLMAPLAVLAVAALAYVVVTQRGRRAKKPVAAPAVTTAATPAPVIIPAPRTAGSFGGGV